jgi:hypothetical protein
MALIEDFDRKTLHGFIQDNIELGSTVCTDGLNSYRNSMAISIIENFKTFGREASLCFRAFT